jgi:mycothiol synthase
MSALLVADEPMTARVGPAGLTLRVGATADDVSDLVRIYTAANLADRVDDRVSDDSILHWLATETPHFDPTRDVVVASVDGLPVGYGWTSWIDASDGRRDYATRGYVHPEWRRQGIGTAILAHNEGRLREVAASHDVDRPRTFTAIAPERRAGAVALLTGAGYEPSRWFFEMLRPSLEKLEIAPLPNGLVVRPGSAVDQRAIWDAQTEAFEDHWGGFDTSDQAFRAWTQDPDFDQTLFTVAWDRDQVAGAVLGIINDYENAELGIMRGLLDSVFVRRAWRGRGLALALVTRNLALLRERGMTSAWLGVDADNPLGALRLYEKAGFAVDTRSTAYRKPMEENR